jgi:hypothetical protein
MRASHRPLGQLPTVSLTLDTLAIGVQLFVHILTGTAATRSVIREGELIAYSHEI